MRRTRGPRSGPVPPVYLHIGTMKSGTTYLQQVLIDNKEQLASAGVLFPGETWKAQVRAAQDVALLLQRDPVYRRESKGAWRSLAGEMLDHRGVASVVSMEFLAYAGPWQVRRAIRGLEPAETHVVLTVRDAARTIPGQWQTAVKSQDTISWHDYQAGVRRADGVRARLGRLGGDRTAAGFRSVHDVSRILDAWAGSVPGDHLHVVTVPPSGSDPTLLWRRFATVVGLDPEMGLSSPPANESLGYASTEVFRRLNAALADVPLHDYNATVKQHVGERILAQRSREEARPRLDRVTYEFALGWNARTREAITRTGAHLVGDLDDLPTEPAGAAGTVDDAQTPPTEQELLEAARLAVRGMREVVERQQRRAARRGLDTDVPHLASAAAASEVEAGPLDRAIAQVADLCRASIELRHRIRG